MNWGKAITIFIVAFMAFIASMVFYAFTKDADLVRDDYYENELQFDNNKNSLTNYKNLGEQITIASKEEGVVFNFPSSMSSANNGKIVFYRPDQKKLDRKFDLAINSNHQQILEYANFKTGYYEVSVEWNDGETNYIFEDNISF